MVIKTPEWPKKISVDRKIVQTLSGSTYDNFPKSIKELIINSYDAFATRVEISIDEKNERIIIEDNGAGMTSDDFDFYIRIAGSTRTKSSSLSNRYNRQKVGKFGVGFLSTFPFFKNFYIESKKSGTPQYLYANIPCSNYFDDQNNFTDVSDIPISGGIKEDFALRDNHYTKIILSGFTRLSSAFFNEEYSIKSLRKTILRFSPLDRLTWELSEDLPIEYRNSQMQSLLYNKIETLPFEVFLNKKKLFREIHGDSILEKHTESEEIIGNIKFKYFIATNYAPISPAESRHLKIRNLNVGVGSRETFGIGLEGKVYGKLAWLTGEILVSEGLNDTITVSRDKFNYSPEFEDFKEFFREKLRFWSNNLDDLNRLQKDIDERINIDTIKSIDSLNADGIVKQIKHLQGKGYVVKTNDQNQNIHRTTPKVEIHRESKEIVIYGDLQTVGKKLEFDSKTFLLLEQSWDHISDLFPACKIDGQNIIINTSYPLFLSRNFDSILKFQLILTKNLLDGVLNNDSYVMIQKDLLKTFS